MKLLLLAGEESGDLYARHIREEVLRLHPDAEIRGFGDYGFTIADLAVFGIWAVLRRILFFLRVKRTMQRVIDTWRPDVLCTIDYPGMNLKLAAYAKARGIRAVHVVCPQVWAWKQGRIPRIEASMDRLCCFFPFEPALFREGFATFVGHPLVEAMAEDTRQTTRRGCGAVKRLALLPGSRLGEIEKHLPTLLRAAVRLQAAVRPAELHVVIPAANEKAQASIERLIGRLGGDLIHLEVVLGRAREVLKDSTCAAIASGTATLESALVHCPFVLVYRVSELLAILLRRMITGVRHVGLINVIAEKAGAKCPMPELLQENFTEENLVRELLPWLTEPVSNDQARQRLEETLRLLETRGGAIAQIVQNLI